MTSFTRLGASIWAWDPWNVLGSDERILWLALYTSQEAKRILPGLWHGTVAAMADAARMQPSTVFRCLDTLLENELVEYDQRHRVLRLTELPDGGDWPNAPYILDSWWKRFLTVPPCAVRDAHVQTVRWILERGALESSRSPTSKNRSGKPSQLHEEVWTKTFATVQIPPPRRRGIRSFAQAFSDTGTTNQPSLFSAPGSGSDLPSSSSSDSPVVGPSEGSYPQPDRRSADSAGSSSDRIKSNTLSATPSGIGEGEGEREGEGDIFSSSPERGIGGEVPIPPKPHLALVPMPTAVSVTDMLTALADAFGGKFRPDVREGLQDRLQALANELGTNGQGIDDVRLAASWLASGRGAFLIGQIPGDPHSRLSAWVADRANLRDAIAAAKEHQRISSERLEMLEQSKAILGGKP